MMLGLEDEARVEKLKEEYVTSADLEDQQIEKWEKLKLGHSQVHRLSRVGRDAVNIRMQKLINKSNATGEKVEEDPFLQEHRDRSAAYFSNTGKAMLQMQIYVEQEEKETRKWSNKALEAGKLLRRKVKVSEQEEDAADGPKKRQSLSIDKDWDTASWSDEQICAGMDYLFYIFVDPIYSQNDQHKALAVQMIDRLLVRSPAACAHFLEQLESIVSRAISRFIRLGMCKTLNRFRCAIVVTHQIQSAIIPISNHASLSTFQRCSHIINHYHHHYSYISLSDITF